MYAKIKLNTILHKNCIVIPVDSYISNDGKKYVYVLNQDNTVTKKEITTGVTVDAQTQVLSGLIEGDKVVVSGVQSLTDGIVVHDIGGK